MIAVVEEKRRKTTVRKRSKPYEMRSSDVTAFLEKVRKDGRSESTLAKYQCDLNRFYEYLDEDKLVLPDTLPQWKQCMLDSGYAARTINSNIVAINRFYEYVGCRDWQLFEWMDLPENDAPELSREDYLQLLQEARKGENIQYYLIIKILASTDLTPGDMPLLTREAVNAGIVSGKTRGGQPELILPATLREDLLNYAVQRGIKTGPIFLNSKGRPHSRSIIAKQIADLGYEIGLEPGKANPRNLRRLHLNTLSEFQRKADDWVKNSYQQLLDEEENSIGWRRG